MSSIANYAYYTIQWKYDKDPNGQHGYMHVTRARRNPTAVTQCHLDPRKIHGNHHYHWLFIQVDANAPGHYYIVNRHSGLNLRVPALDGSSMQARSPLEPVRWESGCVIQDEYSPMCDPEFRFVAEEVAPASGSPDEYRIVSYLTGNDLVVTSSSDPDSAKNEPVHGDGRRIAVNTAGLEDAPGITVTQVDVDERSDDPLKRQPLEPPIMKRQLPKVTSIDQELPMLSPAKLEDAMILAEDTIPFFKIDDPDLATFRQVDVSPYYLFRQRQRWVKTLDRQFDGRIERKTTETLLVGMSQSNAASYKSTFKWGVETTVKAGYSGYGASVEASVTAKVESEVEKTQQQSATAMQERTRTEELTYPARDAMYRIITWVPTDVYELCRMNGAAVQVWTVTRSSNETTVFVDEKERVPKERPHRPAEPVGKR